MGKKNVKVKIMLYIVLPSSYWNHKVSLEMLLRLWSVWGSWSAQRQTSGRYRSTMVCHLLPRKLHSLKSLTCSKVLDISNIHERKASSEKGSLFGECGRFVFFCFFRTLSLFGSTFWTCPSAASTSCSVFFLGVGRHIIAGISWRKVLPIMGLMTYSVGDSFLWIMMQLFPCSYGCPSRTGQLQDTLDFHVISKAVDVENQWPPSQRGWTATRVSSDRDRYKNNMIGGRFHRGNFRICDVLEFVVSLLNDLQ